MPDENPLVAAPKDDTTAVTGIGIAESAMDLADGISNGDWVEAGLGAVGVGLEVLGAVIDPLGTSASYGVAWLIEHVKPLKEALDWLAGDPPVIRLAGHDHPVRIVAGCRDVSRTKSAPSCPAGRQSRALAA